MSELLPLSPNRRTVVRGLRFDDLLGIARLEEMDACADLT
jgi:hypothetical protein